MIRYAAAVVLVACGGSVATNGDAAVDATTDTSQVADTSPDVDPCATVVDAGCGVKPLSCVSGPLTNLAEQMALYAGLAPSDGCPTGVWTERYEACGRIAIHTFEGPPITYWFDAQTGALIGISSETDTGCTGFGDVGFPCNQPETCAHLCGAFTQTIEPPKCPPVLDAGPG